mmetsp:Transcript_24650/g.42067  ORF Transcript_24650/g.42067 Transcript_24650/m.42067 type:complete len:257 (+) Transcript_24650:344-1114(+)
MHGAVGYRARVRPRRLHRLAPRQRRLRLADPLVAADALLLVGDHAREAPPLHEPHDDGRDVGAVHRQPREEVGQVRQDAPRHDRARRQDRGDGLVRVLVRQRDGRAAEPRPVALQPGCARAVQAEGQAVRHCLQHRHAPRPRRRPPERQALWPVGRLPQLPHAADDYQLLPDLDHLHAAHAPRRAPLRRRGLDVAARRPLHDRPHHGPLHRREAAPHLRLARRAPHLLRHALLRREGGDAVREGAPGHLLQVGAGL